MKHLTDDFENEKKIEVNFNSVLDELNDAVGGVLFDDVDLISALIKVDEEMEQQSGIEREYFRPFSTNMEVTQSGINEYKKRFLDVAKTILQMPEEERDALEKDVFAITTVEARQQKHEWMNNEEKRSYEFIMNQGQEQQSTAYEDQSFFIKLLIHTVALLEDVQIDYRDYDTGLNKREEKMHEIIEAAANYYESAYEESGHLHFNENRYSTLTESEKIYQSYNHVIHEEFGNWNMFTPDEIFAYAENKGLSPKHSKTSSMTETLDT